MGDIADQPYFPDVFYIQALNYLSGNLQLSNREKDTFFFEMQGLIVVAVKSKATGIVVMREWRN